MSSKPRVLVVGGRDSSVDWPGREGFELVLLQEATRVSPRQAELASVVEVADISNVGAYLPVLKRLHADQHFSAVVSFFETGLLPAAHIGELLDVPHNSLFSVETTRRKTALRELLAGTPFSVPFTIVRTNEEIREFYSKHGCCIVKPVDGSGSVEVHKVEKEDFSLPTVNREFIAEKFLEGQEYSVETFTCDKKHQLLGVTKKYTTGAPHFVETGHDFPVELPGATHAQVRDAVLWLLDQIGHVWGPCHTEVKVDGEQVYFIETQTRFGGDQIWEMVWRTTGIHLAAATIYALTGRQYSASPVEFSSMAVRFPQFSADTDGTNEKDKLHRKPFVIRTELNEANFGRPFISSSQRHGYVLFGCKANEQKEFKSAINNDFFINTKE